MMGFIVDALRLTIFVDRLRRYGILYNDFEEATSIRRKAPWFLYDTITYIIIHMIYGGMLLHCILRKDTKETASDASWIIQIKGN